MSVDTRQKTVWVGWHVGLDGIVDKLTQAVETEIGEFEQRLPVGDHYEVERHCELVAHTENIELLLPKPRGGFADEHVLPVSFDALVHDMPFRFTLWSYARSTGGVRAMYDVECME